ncbi:tetratricopeptide repeat protein [bacterium]|nr:tetratricopeptide repeat protein [bacterium]
MNEEEKEKLLRFALLYLKRGEIKKAISTCQQILNEEPEDPSALELMGDIKSMQGDLQEALSFYKKALEKNPSAGEVEKKLARTVLKINEEAGKFDLNLPPVKRFPLIAGLLSLVFAGLGQLYNGDTSKGIAGIVLGAIFVIIPFAFKIPWFFLLWGFLNFAFAMEAYTFAKRGSEKEEETDK